MYVCWHLFFVCLGKYDISNSDLTETEHFKLQQDWEMYFSSYTFFLFYKELKMGNIKIHCTKLDSMSEKGNLNVFWFILSLAQPVIVIHV